jgi:hypothetical protein
MTSVAEEFTLPNLIKVNVGVISLPTDLDANTLTDYETLNREVLHLLALLPEEDKKEFDYDDGYFYIHTDNVAALKYACNKYFIDECLTTCHAVEDCVVEHFNGDVCPDCVAGYIDEAVEEHNYECVVLETGVYIRKEHK